MDTESRPVKICGLFFSIPSKIIEAAFDAVSIGNLLESDEAFAGISMPEFLVMLVAVAPG